jgi:hypothetical protein
MNVFTPGALGIAGLGFILAVTSSSATSAGPRRVSATNPGQGYRTMARQPRLRRNATTTCSTNNASFSFVGFSGAMNVAGGEYSAVPGGSANDACGEYSGVGAGYDNIVADSDGTSYSFIGGGSANIMNGEASLIGAGESNSASGRDSVVAAGNNGNASGNSSMVGAGQLGASAGIDSFIGSGYSDSVSANGIASFVGAGFFGTVTGQGSFIGAGGSNCNCNSTINLVSGNDSFLGAGDLNTVASNESFLGSGENNTINSAASYASILGGSRNAVSGEYASILGGFGNAAIGSYAIVAGGDGNLATGIVSFAGGYHADAAHNGSFVWSDYVSGSAQAKDTAADQFIARASGGTYFYSNEAMTAGVQLTPGSGAFASLSDRNAKTGIVPLDDDSVLAKVAALPVSSWSYKTENGVRHIGPMAQDFYAAFGVGADDRHITSIDEDGIALAAIKALHRENSQLHANLVRVRNDVAARDAELATQHGQIATLQRRMQRLETEFEATPAR